MLAVRAEELSQADAFKCDFKTTAAKLQANRSGLVYQQQVRFSACQRIERPSETETVAAGEHESLRNGTRTA
jgi:hypothetical protein